MANYIALRAHATMVELMEEFGVSMNTIRSDVAYLVKTGAVTKVYGGVQSATDSAVPFFQSRVARNACEKKAIAQRAASVVENGDCIYVDSGTTAMYLPDYISPQKKVTIITGNMYVINTSANLANIHLVVLPGELDRRTNSLKGPNTVRQLAEYQIGKAFMGCTGVTVEGKISVSTYPEYEIKKAALRQSRYCYLLADSSKFLEGSALSYGDLEQMDCVFTDRRLQPETAAFCAARAIPVELV